ncbi:MAG: DUF86 domain-containing protein [Planctomycetes bacterium]|nr:DUF86 domain-containing protein [Planctomycetota bacterium]
MKKRDPQTLLSDIRHHAELGIRIAATATRDQFLADEPMQLALTRVIEVIGEAAGRLDQDTKNRLSDVPWHEIIAMRHILAHAYDILDLDRLWETAMDDLPKLVEVTAAEITRLDEVNT